jgi:hypothetical protein
VLEPIPPTSETLRELGKYGDTEVADVLLGMGTRMTAVVPELVGLSLALVKEGLTFTLVASNELVAQLDAVQYLGGGPCVAAEQSGEVVTFRQGEALDEQRWQLFGRATSAAGVASTLSLPIMHGDTVYAGLNMYASTAHAFDDHHAELARISGAWAPGAVSNADLSFSSRLEAAVAPARLIDRGTVDRAVGVLAGAQGLDDGAARERVRQAAARAGITDAQAARAIIDLLAG